MASQTPIIDAVVAVSPFLTTAEVAEVLEAIAQELNREEHRAAADVLTREASGVTAVDAQQPRLF